MSPRGIFNKTHLLSQCPKSPKRHHHHQRRPYINSDKHQRSPILYYACPLRALVSRRYSSKHLHHHQVGSVYSVHVSTDQVSSTGHPLPSGDDVLCRWSPRGGELSDVIRWRRDRSVLVCTAILRSLWTARKLRAEGCFLRAVMPHPYQRLNVPVSH